MYEDWEAMKEALAKISKNITKGGLPKDESPMVFAVTGTGRVAQGILEVLELLPHVKVEPDNLEAYIESVKDDKARTKKIIIAQYAAKDLVKLKVDNGQAFDKKHYYQNPHLYTSKFHEHLHMISWLVNGVYWEAKFPRVLSNNELKAAHEAGKSKLLGVCDISADYEGSIEFTSQFTSIEEPFLVWDTVKGEFRDKIDKADKDCILFHSVDHLPAEMPKEASNHFGEQLLQFVEKVANSDINKPFAEQEADLPAEIYNAILTSHGELTPNYKYIAELRSANEKIKAVQLKLEEERKQEEAQPQKKGLTRNLSLVTMSLQGHLFDTKAFNQTIDICENNKIQFRVIGWEIGNVGNQDSTVSIQMMSKDKSALGNAMDEIEAVASKCGIQIMEGDHTEGEDGLFTQHANVMDFKD